MLINWNKYGRPVFAPEIGTGTAVVDTVAQQAAVTPPVAAPTPQWYDGLPAEDKGFLENRGWTAKTQTEALQETIKSYRHAEQRLGAPASELVRMPKSDAPKEQWDAFHNAIGRPTDAAGYEINVPQGEDRELADWVSKEAHELGMTKKQGQDWYNKLTGMMGEINSSQSAQVEQAVGEEKAMLKNNWGQSFDKNMQLARTVVEKLGIDASVINSLESELGYSKVVQMFYDIGKATGEDKVIFGEGASAIAVSSREGALAQIEALKTDKSFVKRFLEGEFQANNQMQKLHEIAYQG